MKDFTLYTPVLFVLAASGHSSYGQGTGGQQENHKQHLQPIIQRV